MGDLGGKLALVTGGARGVGRAISTELATRGAHVIVNYFHSHDEAKRTKQELQGRGLEVELLRASVAQRDQAERMFAEMDRRHGGLDILINNAANGALVGVSETTEHHLDKAFDTVTKGALWCSQLAAPLMTKRGGGAIVNISALGSSQMVMANYAPCALAKAALESLTRYLAVELAPLAIRVNGASASMLVSAVADQFPRSAEMQDVVRRASPFQRLGTADEFANLVAFLASEDASWITGQIVLADGGLSLGSSLLSPPPTDEPTPGAVTERSPAGADDAIAVVGMGLMTPGAAGPDEFWQRRIAGDSLLVTVPRDRWSRESFHSSDHAAEDKGYQDKCGFITQLADVAPREELTTAWLRDALGQAIDRVRIGEDDRCCFLVGYTPDGSQHLEEATVLAGAARRLAELVAEDDAVPLNGTQPLSQRVTSTLRDRYWRGTLPPDCSLPHRVGLAAMRGVLPRDTAVRMLDTACSSSLYAVDIGVKGLRSGRYHVAVCGGAFALAPRGTILFSKLKGLSQRGEVRALDADSDGVIFADGAAVVVLKTLSRAIADGDDVLALLRGVGTSSDGKGKAVYAPNTSGQRLAMQRAFDNSDLRAGDVDWVVAHATGTPAGDLTELLTLREVFARSEDERPVNVTSNKSLFGHTGWAAGLVSLMEVVLGLRHETIPTQHHFLSAPPEFGEGRCGLRIPRSALRWAADDRRVRCAAVNAFGFGGTNAHVLLSEAPSPVAMTHLQSIELQAKEQADEVGPSRIAIVGWSTHLPELETPAAVAAWIRGEGPPPAPSFGERYPAPPFEQVRMPPITVRTIDRCQLMALACAQKLRRVLDDFWDRATERTGIFVGHMGPTRSAMLYADRCYLDDIAAAMRDGPELNDSSLVTDALRKLRRETERLVPASNEDSFPGMMPNVIPARVANHLGLHGPNLTCDTGLSSSLASLEIACSYLESRELDLALAGGINGNSLRQNLSLVENELAHGSAHVLHEGAAMFALVREETARAVGLPVLAWIDTQPRADVRPARQLECTDASYAGFLGAAGAFAVLDALLGSPDRVAVGDNREPGGESPRIVLSVEGNGANAAPTTQAPLERARGDLQVERFVPKLVESPAIGISGSTIPFVPPGCAILTDQPEMVSSLGRLPDDLVVLSTAPLTEQHPGWHHVSAPSPDAVRQLLGPHTGAVRHARVLGHLRRSAPLDCWTSQPRRDAITALHDLVFACLQACGDGLRAGDQSSIVGLFLGSLDDRGPHPCVGLFDGLLKSVHLEFSGSVVYAVFCDGDDVHEAVRTAEQESTAPRQLPAAFYRDGRRATYGLSKAPTASDDQRRRPLNESSVVVAVGGGRGITAEAMKGLAREVRPRVFLLGSTSLVSQGDSDGEIEITERSTFIRRHLADGRFSTVSECNAAFDRLGAAREVQATLHELGRWCGDDRVTYLTCDVTDPDTTARAIERILNDAGNIDLLINAAGRNRSGPISEKDFAEFRQIRDLKFHGYCNLKQALRSAAPPMWCNFGSLLGFFGQVGEADYASANDLLFSAADAASQDGTDEFTIGWTLWDSVGMGANSLVDAYFRRTGWYTHMKVDEGVFHFLEELRGPRQSACVHLGSAERRTVESFYPGFLASSEPRSSGFYLREAVTRGVGSAVYRCVLDRETDWYLDHHLVRDLPTLPGTFALEMAAEAAVAIAPDLAVVAFESVSFQRFILGAREGASQPYEIHVQSVEPIGSQARAHVRVSCDIVAPNGRVLRRGVPCFQADVLLDAKQASAPHWDARDELGEQAVPDPYLDPQAPVQLSGPFVATTATRVHRHGKRARFAPDLASLGRRWPSFELPCLLLDALARTGVLTSPEDGGLPLAVPTGIGRVDLYESASDLELLTRYGHVELHATPRSETINERANRFVAASPEGAVIAQMSGLSARIVGTLQAPIGATRVSPSRQE